MFLFDEGGTTPNDGTILLLCVNIYWVRTRKGNYPHSNRYLNSYRIWYLIMIVDGGYYVRGLV